MLLDFDDDFDDPFPPILGRTMLFRLEPIGMGTPYCEGLTSYLLRLAQEHSLPVRRFVSRLLFGAGGADTPRFDAKFFRQYAATINGVGPYAQRFSEVLNRATGRTDLDALTMRPWRWLLPSNGTALTSPWRRWCPECLRTGLPGRTGAYWPLAWSIAAVRRCSRHGVGLLDRCPHCARRQPAVPRLADLVHCHACGEPLARPPGDAAAASLWSDVPLPGLSVAEELIELNRSIDAAGVRRQWVDAVSARMSRMGCDRASLCRRVGLNPRAMNAWMNKSCAVSMESLVRVHAGLAMSASEIFGPRRRARWRPGAAGSVGTDSAASLPRHSVEARSRAGSLLDEALGAAQPPKLKDIAAAVGASTGFVRYWHSDKVAQLRERNLDIQRRERDARRDRHRREVGAAIEGLRAKGVFPGRKAVEAVVRARGTTLIEPDNYKAYRAAVLTRCS